MTSISPPDASAILPPLVACLPTSLVSTHPPPALLPLLTPILQQRVQLLSTSTQQDTKNGTWLSLLCWKAEQADQLVNLVRERTDLFELHPTSGEIELGTVEPVRYRRLDGETLHARLVAPHVELIVVLLWCLGENDGEKVDVKTDGGEWLVAEVLPLATENGSHDASKSAGTLWTASIPEANARFYKSSGANINGSESFNGGTYTNGNTNVDAARETAEDNDADDAYWSMYDRTPGRTPGPASALTATATPRNGGKHTDRDEDQERSYFERYAAVQPEMDPDNPDEERGEKHSNLPSYNDSLKHDFNGSNGMNDAPHKHTTVYHQPTPSSPPFSHHSASSSASSHRQSHASHLEDLVQQEDEQRRQEAQNAIGSRQSHIETYSQHHYAHDTAVRQHISTSIKSLYRLCRATGSLSRREFGELIAREVQCCGLEEGYDDLD